MIDLAGKCALVTGGGQRVGRAIAVALGACGMRVLVHYRSSRLGAEQTVAEIKELGGEAFCIGADLGERNQARKLVDAGLEQWGALDVLVPSAASFERAVYDHIDDALWDRTLELNLTAPFTLVQHATPALKAAKGCVVFITCSSATVPFKNYLPYVVSKGALRQLMRVLALELAPEVRVNAVAPGTVLPPATMSASAVERLVSQVPLARTGTPEDVANAVVFLARSPYITGHEIAVDGGRSIVKTERFG
ncbi:MAG TPA: SDR family oxidoreductase [Polyangiaceae bacterium]|jgi:pteridine reductase